MREHLKSRGREGHLRRRSPPPPPPHLKILDPPLESKISLQTIS